MLEILAAQAPATGSSARLIRANPIDTRPCEVGLETRCATRAYEGVSLGTVKVRSEAESFSDFNRDGFPAGDLANSQQGLIAGAAFRPVQAAPLRLGVDFGPFDACHAGLAPAADGLVPQPMSCGASTVVRNRLCANTNSPTTDYILTNPRTGIRSSPRLRACALTHSAVAARCL